MKTTEKLGILVLALALIVCQTEVCDAAPMGTAFTYQGRLMDSNRPADGLYDFVFLLYDSPDGPNELDIRVVEDLDVVDGFFTVELDFGGMVFDGSARWLWMGVRPGELKDPNGHTMLMPRTALTPMPYAIYAKTAGGGGADSDWIISGNDMYSGVSGNVGIGTPSPNGKLHVRGDSTDGVIGWTGAGDKSGVFGNTQVGTGVTGRSEAASGHGVAGIAIGKNGRGVYGTGSGVGVYGRSDDGVGVEGRSPNADGVVGWTAASGKSGVFGHSQVGIGVAGRSAIDAGVAAVTTSNNPDQAALVARNEGNGLALYAESGTNGLAAVFNGTTSTKVLEITGGADLSEQFQINTADAKVSPSPGMVVSIDPENPGDLVVSSKAYDRRVAGIISGAGGVKPGMLMGQKGSKADGTNPVALTGRVYCWVDASNGPIQPGDLLTTSDTPGHAMKVGDYARAQCAIIGKAMSGLESGRGLVLVLVTLQ